MEVECLNPDRISGLPPDITGNILTRMPIRDAIRTSILSGEWRSGWKTMTSLYFDEKMVKVPSKRQQLKKYKVASAILNVLCRHTGSILDIIIDVSMLDVDSEFDAIICYLSRQNHLQRLSFRGPHKHCYKLPPSFFSLQGLKKLSLYNCVFRPPIIFSGFTKLRGVCFAKVNITSKTLRLFLSNSPLLTVLYLLSDNSRDIDATFATENKFTIVELLQCVPLIELLEIASPYMKHLSARGMLHKLPTSLVHLKRLSLRMCYDEEHEVSSTLCLIRSSPNLKKIYLAVNDDIRMGYHKSDTIQISKNIPDIHDYSGFALDHLEFFQMEYFTNKYRYVDFLKLIMAKSPWLKRAQIELSESVSVEEENELLRDLLQLPFPRASPSVKLIFKRPKPAMR